MMKVKIGDLKLTDGTNIREINDECNKYLMCNPCPYYGDVCDGDMTDVDVEIPQTVKRGKWMLERDWDNHGKPVCYHCSVCDSDWHCVGNRTATPYCPQCGAKMDGLEG